MVIYYWSQGDLVKTEFSPSVPMSSYLVALVISNFKCLSQTVLGVGEEGKVDVRVCGRADAVDNGQLDYALEMGTKLIKALEDFYNVRYPLPKCGKRH